MPSRIKKSTIQTDLKSSLRSKTAVINKRAKRPSVKRKQWTEESMLSAIKAVEEDHEKVGMALLLELLMFPG